MDKQVERKVVLYIAASLDGYIAAPGDDLSFLSVVQQTGEDYGYSEFYNTVDTVIMGRKTYDWVIRQISQPPHTSKKLFIITRAARATVGNTIFYTGSLKELVIRLKSEPGATIYCDGGSEIVYALLREKLIDELIVSLIPVLLGNGVRLFKEGFPSQALALKQSKAFESGLVQLRYEVDHTKA
jgi:dihydrofolate reductase